MPTKIFGAFIFLLALTATAKSTWIGVTGIDSQTLDQNHFDFYTEAMAFKQLCAQNSARHCIAFINRDINLVSPSTSPQERSQINLSGFEQTPSKDQIIDSIKAAISNAKENDQIVIYLKDHGGPDLANGSPSCIWINESEHICENELSKIIGDAPAKKKFKVLVMAGGCYSGGFATLSTKNICVVTTSSQYHTSFGAHSIFWSFIKDNKLKNLSELNSVNGEPQSDIRLASRTAKTKRCETLRRALKENHIDTSIFENIYKPDETLCLNFGTNPRVEALLFGIHLSDFKDVFEKLDQKKLLDLTCKMGTNAECKQAKNILRAGDELTGMTLNGFDRALHFSKTFDSDVDTTLQNLSADEANFVRSAGFGGSDNSVQKFSKDRQQILTERIQNLSSIMKQKDAEAAKIIAQANKYFKNPDRLKSIGKLWPCFIPGDDPNFDSPEDDDQNANKFKDREWTDSNLRDAEKCESTFSLQ